MEEQIKKAQKIGYRDISEDDWCTVKEIFKGIKIMDGNTCLVGNSKVMAHMLPNIIPPIDRQYTLKYLNLKMPNKDISKKLEREWNLMKTIIVDFFIPIAKNPTFYRLAEKWIENVEEYPWDTSVFKVIDNIVIGFGKSKKNGKNSRK